MNLKGLVTIVVCAATLAVLGGCAMSVPLHRAQIDTFRLGDPAAVADAKIGKSTPIVEHTFSHKGKSYLAKHFNLQTGTTQSGTVVCTPACIYIPITVPVYAPFVVVYDGGATVRAFGILEELSKGTDEEVRDFMPELKVSMQAAFAAKKQQP